MRVCACACGHICVHTHTCVQIEETAQRPSLLQRDSWPQTWHKPVTTACPVQGWTVTHCLSGRHWASGFELSKRRWLLGLTPTALTLH